jgi:uncharacterized Zn-finger protein
MALNEHMMEIHGVKYECTECQEQCKSNFSLNRHMINAHDIKKTYKCELCETEFTAKSSLIDHEKYVFLIHLVINYINVCPKKVLLQIFFRY